ncbi:MAG: NADH-quinone oxidoreductase subunit H [Candidatus Omnitrophica bacterium]|nr:NADH-quinone oxidoreductase subunit H [Candidatus Omnitrophota bacterium]
MLKELFNILVFPGLLFLFIFGMAIEFVDRKLCARLQNRIGPPWYQPLADFIKLLGKEDVVPQESDVAVFKLGPVFALAAAATAFLYIPLWNKQALFSFSGDIIVVFYLLTIPTLVFFLGGWYSRSVFSMIGAVRTLTQFFAYEVPLFMCILSSSLLANTWSLSEMTVFYLAHPWCWLFTLPGFFIALIALLGKLEKVPFDIPEAETEIVAGAFTEYGGRFLAFLRTVLNMEMVVGSSLLAAVFLPFGFVHNAALSFMIFIAKILFITALIAVAHSVVARLRLNQMVSLCWRVFAPLAFLQVLISLVIKGFLVMR